MDQHDRHVKNWLIEKTLWQIMEALGLHNDRGQQGLAEWYEYAAAGEWQ